MKKNVLSLSIATALVGFEGAAHAADDAPLWPYPPRDWTHATRFEGTPPADCYDFRKLLETQETSQ